MNLAYDPAAITTVFSVSLQTEEYSQIQVVFRLSSLWILVFQKTKEHENLRNYNSLIITGWFHRSQKY